MLNQHTHTYPLSQEVSRN